MPIAVLCPSCNARLNAPDASAGKTVKCPKCQAAIVLPVPQVEPEPEPAPAPKKSGTPARAEREAASDNNRFLYRNFAGGTLETEGEHGA